MLEKLTSVMTQLDEKYALITGTLVTPRGEVSRIDQAERDSVEYIYFKLMYKKAKAYRKTRMLKSADETC